MRLYSLYKKAINLLRLLFVKFRWYSHLTFPWRRCWNIRIGRRFEIKQFPPPLGHLKVILGANITIEKDVWLKGSSLLSIGSNTFICRRTVIGCNERISIGHDCLLAENVRIQDTDHQFESRNIPIRQQGIATAPIKIGNDVWIGYGAVITKGVKIGDGCVIGANSVVTHDIPPYSVAVGVPARVIKQRGDVL